MSGDAFTDVERRFLEELERRNVRYLVVGMTAAVLQGARGVTEAARSVGAIYVSGTFGMRPPMLGGALGDRFDVVTNVDGAEDFAAERSRAVMIIVSGVSLPVMPLARVAASKRASGRAKDLAQLPALEEALAVQAAERDSDPDERR